jgi:hypothetical protein
MPVRYSPLPGYVMKETNTIVPSTSWVPDGELKVAAEAAGELWYIRVCAFITAEALDDFSFRITNLDVVVGEKGWIVYTVYNGAVIDVRSQLSSQSVGGASGESVGIPNDIHASTDAVFFEGLMTSAAAGDMEFQWQKDGVAGGDMAVTYNSWMTAMRIA